MMEGCKKCKKIGGVIFLILGVLFLLNDYGVWTWKVSWWSALFLVMGLCKLAMCHCPDCMAMDGKKK